MFVGIVAIVVKEMMITVEEQPALLLLQRSILSLPNESPRLPPKDEVEDQTSVEVDDKDDLV